jgi:hypothetical protein
MVKAFALAVQVISLLGSAIFAWILWYLLANPPLWMDGPEPNTVEYFLALDRWELLGFVSVGVFLLLSVAGLLSALALYRGRDVGRVGVASVMASVLVMASIDWILEGSTRDLLTLAAVGAMVFFSEWVLFFFPPVANVFKRQRVVGGVEVGSASRSVS